MMNGVFIDGLPLHGHFLNREESAVLYRLSRINYENMHLYRFNRQQRMRLLELMLDYYRLHSSAIGELRSPAILSALFE